MKEDAAADACISAGWSFFHILVITLRFEQVYVPVFFLLIVTVSSLGMLMILMMMNLMIWKENSLGVKTIVVVVIALIILI